MSAKILSATPQFVVRDLVSTAAHYRDVLGFSVNGFWDGERVHADPPPRPLFLIVERDGVEVFFSAAGEHEPLSPAPSAAYSAYFRMRGVDELGRELQERGAEILHGPAERIYGQRELIVRDCNGLVLTFAERSNAQDESG